MRSPDGGPVAPGEIVDNCRIEELCGAGAFGAVYRAYHLGLDHPRALKFLLPRPNLAPDAKARFVGEARTTAKLAHAHIVTVHNVGEHRGLPFINMEFLVGESLRHWLGNGPLPLEAVLRVADQTLSALAAAHDRGFVHRDVKPENTMILEDGNVKVVDFGLSLNISGLEGRVTHASDAIMGTPLYMAPEQWSSSTVGPQADVWSVGVMLYELLTGLPPFRGTSLMELMGLVVTADHVPISRVAPSCPSGLALLVESMLRKEARERPASARVARDTLQRGFRVRDSALAVRSQTSTDDLRNTIRRRPVADAEHLPTGVDGTQRLRRSSDRKVMVALRGAEFTMGSEAGDRDERPVRTVRVSPFFLDESPVTRAEFSGFLSLWGTDRDDESNRLLDLELAQIERMGSVYQPMDDADRPVTGVTWHGAASYARWAGVELSSEAQLEYAMLCLADPNDTSTSHVTDLVRSIRHWCFDTYDEGFYARASSKDPVNAAPGAFASIRGLSRSMEPLLWARSQRQFAFRHDAAMDQGFRCVLRLQ